MLKENILGICVEATNNIIFVQLLEEHIPTKRVCYLNVPCGESKDEIKKGDLVIQNSGWKVRRHLE